MDYYWINYNRFNLSVNAHLDSTNQTIGGMTMKQYDFTLKYNRDNISETIGVVVYAEEKIQAMHLALDYCDEIGYNPFDAVSMICDNQVVFA
jgi:hypothetical protein